MNRANCNDIETCKIMKLNTQTDIKGKGNILQWWAAIPSGHCGYCVSLSKNRMKTNCYHLGKPMTIMMNEHFFLFGLPSQKSLLKAVSLPLSLSRFPPHPIPHCVINNVKPLNRPHLHGPNPLQMALHVRGTPLCNLVNRST